MSVDTVSTPHRLSCAPSRAARELGLRRGELDLAVHLGHIQTVPDEGGGGRRVPRSEIDRLCTHEGFPESLRERVKAVGTTEGAAVMEVPPGRFTRLARLGLVVPVTFYLNRYRAVVWQYLAEELRQFAADEKNTRLLTARMPEGLRDQLDSRPGSARSQLARTPPGIPAPAGRRPVGAGRGRGRLPGPPPDRGDRPRPLRALPSEPLQAGATRPWRTGLARRAPRREDHDGGRPGRDRLAEGGSGPSPGGGTGTPARAAPRDEIAPHATIDPRDETGPRDGAPPLTRARGAATAATPQTAGMATPRQPPARSAWPRL